MKTGLVSWLNWQIPVNIHVMLFSLSCGSLNAVHNILADSFQIIFHQQKTKTKYYMVPNTVHYFYLTAIVDECCLDMYQKFYILFPEGTAGLCNVTSVINALFEHISYCSWTCFWVGTTRVVDPLQKHGWISSCTIWDSSIKLCVISFFLFNNPSTMPL